MNNKQKGFAVSIIIAVVTLLAIGGIIYFFVNKEGETQISGDKTKIVVPSTTTLTNETDTVTSINDKTATIQYDKLNFSFSYPNDWYVYKEDPINTRRVYLVKDSTDLEGNSFTEIKSAHKTHIEIGLYTDRYTPEIIKGMYNPIKIEENKKLTNKFNQTLTWFSTRGIHPPGSTLNDLISSYVMLLPFDRPKTLFVSLAPFDENEINDTKAVEKIMSSFSQIK